MTTKAEFKKLFDKHMKILDKFRESQTKFNIAIDEVWGYHYSDKDNDCIIDAIDIGNGMAYETFVEMMDAGDDWFEVAERRFHGNEK